MCNDDWEADPDSWKYDEDDDVVQARQEDPWPPLETKSNRKITYTHSEEPPF